MLRRTLATAAIAGIALVGLAPAASANTNIVEAAIANADCRVVDPALRAVFTINENTTRSDLAKQIRDEAKGFTLTDPRTYLLSAQFAGQIADKALACGIVKPDPQLIPGSSHLPNVNDIQDILANLSSTLTPKR